MKYSVKLPAIALALSLVIIGFFTSIYIITYGQKTDGLAINLAGRQRALSQKMTKELLFCVCKVSRKVDCAADKASLENSMKVFSMTLTALKNGTDAPLSLDLQNAKMQKCPVPDDSARQLLTAATEAWGSFEQDIKKAIDGGFTIETGAGSIEKSNMAVLASFEKVVAYLQNHSANRVKKLFNIALICGLFGFIAIGLIFLLLVDLLKKLGKADEITSQFAKGDLTGRILVKNKTDELDNTLDNINRLGENVAGIAGQIVTANKTLVGVAGEFSTTFSSISENAQTVRDSTTSVAAASEEVSANVHSISAGTEQMSASVRTVAVSMEEMSASISEVARNCQQEATITKKAQNEVSATGKLMQDLGTSAKEIGRIIGTINDIADKTNLLALNATIEAASAGEAGKGFAVVANEVKALARQTSKATTIIREQIEKMQNDTNASVTAMTTISGVIDEVYSISHNIAAAVEEQSVTANEISRNLSEVSTVAVDIAKNIGEIAIGANDVSKNIAYVSNETVSVANNIINAQPQVQNLLVLGKELGSLISTFKIKGQKIEWSDDFSVKVSDMDAQHKKLFGMINDLNDAISSGKGRDAVSAVLKRLVDYVVEHFGEEEKLLASVNYPELDQQKQMHAMFIKKSLEFKESFDSGKALVGTDIVLFLKDWLIQHIMRKDKQYGPWVKKHRR